MSNDPEDNSNESEIIWSDVEIDLPLVEISFEKIGRGSRIRLTILAELNCERNTTLIDRGGLDEAA